jgi:hypothetical protein
VVGALLAHAEETRAVRCRAAKPFPVRSYDRAAAGGSLGQSAYQAIRGPRYAVCLGDPGGYEDPSRLLRLLPAPAKPSFEARNGRTARSRSRKISATHERSSKCFEVTTEEARALDQILKEAGFQAGVEAYFGFNRGPVSLEPVPPT